MTEFTHCVELASGNGRASPSPAREIKARSIAVENGLNEKGRDRLTPQMNSGQRASQIPHAEPVAVPTSSTERAQACARMRKGISKCPDPWKSHRMHRVIARGCSRVIAALYFDGTIHLVIRSLLSEAIRRAP